MYMRVMLLLAIVGGLQGTPWSSQFLYRFFLFDHIEQELERLATIEKLLRDAAIQPKLELGGELCHEEVSLCAQRILLNQSILPMFEWWNSYKGGARKGDPALFKEVLRLIALIYHDYLVHLGSLNQQDVDAAVAEIDQTVKIAMTLEQLLYVLDNAYRQLHKLLIGLQNTQESAGGTWGVYSLPLVALLLVCAHSVLSFLSGNPGAGQNTNL